MTQPAPDALALPTRSGRGARQDAPGAPAAALRLARHGMAFFARHLIALADGALAEPSLARGWRRAHLVAHVSLQARAQALALAALRGQPPEDGFGWAPDVDLAASLPVHALRHLFEHAHVHVNVEWRDLPTAGWDRMVSLPPEVAARDLPQRQADLLWWGAVALDTGARPADLPPASGRPPDPLRDALLRADQPGGRPEHP